MLLCLTAVTAILGLLVAFYKYWFSYWKRHGLDYLEPTFPFGNTSKLFTQKLSFGQQFAAYYKQFKANGWKHGGVYVFTRPFYIPVEAEIIKSMMIKDFQHFVDRGFYTNEKVDPLSGHLFAMEGTKWKNLRNKLSATFTSGKMKMMFDTMADTAKELNAVLSDEAKSGHPIDIKEILARFTTDVISSCAFGLESNSLRNPNAQFRKYGRRMFENTFWENMRNLFQFVVPPKYLNRTNFKVTKPDVEDFMLKIVEKTVSYREQNNIYRKDFMHLLLQLKNRGKLADDELIFKVGEMGEGVLNLEEVAAQVFVFFLAGFETSSTTMTFALYELSRNQNVQNKLRQEIQTVLKKHNNQISYEAIMDMPYLDKVINESLRMYPALPFLNRKCTVPYQVPGTNIKLEEGTMVVIPILGIQMDSEYFPNPSQFDPERFSEEKKRERPQIAHMPFGDGPRNCVGLRFGLMQTKIGLTTILNNFKLSINAKTVQPLEIDPTVFIHATKQRIYMNLNKISNIIT